MIRLFCPINHIQGIPFDNLLPGNLALKILTSCISKIYASLDSFKPTGPKNVTKISSPSFPKTPLYHPCPRLPQVAHLTLKLMTHSEVGTKKWSYSIINWLLLLCSYLIVRFNTFRYDPTLPHLYSCALCRIFIQNHHKERSIVFNTCIPERGPDY